MVEGYILLLLLLLLLLDFSCTYNGGKIHIATNTPSPTTKYFSLVPIMEEIYILLLLLLLLLPSSSLSCL